MAKANRKARESGNFWTKRFDHSGNFISKMSYIKRQKKSTKKISKPTRKAKKQLKKYGIATKSQKLKKQSDYGFKLAEWWMMQHA